MKEQYANIMKSSTIKTVVVRLTAENVSEFGVDVSIFDDPLMEAATRAVEQTRKMEHGIIRAVTECWEKTKPKESKIYNSYWILVNASCFAKAEQLREKFKLQTNCDLATEPICSSDKGSKT